MIWREVADYEEMSHYGADRIFDAAAPVLRAGKWFNLGLATGNTMLKLYEFLADRFNREAVDLAKLRTFNLDEYIGQNGREIPETYPLSYRKYMQENLFSRFDPERKFDPANAHFPPAANAPGYDKLIAECGGLDLQLLGIGFNGHIAFNEPMSEDVIGVETFAALPSRIIDLTEMTIQTNTRLTAGNDRSLMPYQAVTMGMAPIVAARDLLLLACFPEQQKPLQAVKTGRVTPELPASYLHRGAKAEIVYTGDCIAL